MENKITEERLREIIKEELNSFLEKVEQKCLEKISNSLQQACDDIFEA